MEHVQKFNFRKTLDKLLARIFFISFIIYFYLKMSASFEAVTMIDSTIKLADIWLIARKSRLSYEWHGKKQRDVKLDGGFSSGSSQGD